MIKTINLLLLLISFLITSKGFAQTEATPNDLMETIFEQEKLLQDFDICRQALEKGHGGLYWFITKDSFDLIFEDAKAKIDQDMSLRSFYRILSPIIEATHDAHTALYMPETYIDYYRTSATLFPFNLYFYKKKAYIIKNLSIDSTIVDGSEILTFNNEPIQDIVTKIQAALPSDGYNLTGKYQKMNNHYFTFRYWSLFGDIDSLVLTIRNPKGDTLTHHLRGSTYKEAKENIKTRYKRNSRKPLLHLQYHQLDGMKFAIMTVNSFSTSLLKKQNLKFKPFIKKAFKELEKKEITDLIIDVRRNNGGYSHLVDFLTQYFLEEDFLYYTHADLKVKKTFLDNGTDKPIKINPFKGYPERLAAPLFKKQTDGTYTRRKLKPISPHKKHRFTGRLYVLISGLSVSGGSKFPSAIHRTQRGILIGEETRGGYYGNTAGYINRITLPNTELSMRLPFVNHRNEIMTDIPFGRGVIPDHEVIPSVQDVLKKKDVQLRYAIKMLLNVGYD